MATPIFFGVEIEFNLAYLYEGQALPDPDSSCQIVFPVTESVKTQVMKAIKQSKGLGPDDPVPDHVEQEYQTELYVQVVQSHLRETLRSIGCNVQEGSYEEEFEVGPSVWEVTLDRSVFPTERVSGEFLYNWLPIEINSPALPFTPASLELIVEACSLIKKTYLTDPNYSTGVHVHISAGTIPLQFRTMQKFLVFVWAFEYQMNSLHPEDRQDNEYCRGFRESSRLVDKFIQKWGVPPTILQGIIEFYKCEDLRSLLTRGLSYSGDKHMAFNCLHAWQNTVFPDRYFKPTIECRQHQGTLDGERISQWVKLIVGIVQRLETIHPESFLGLLELVQYETWEKTGNDSENRCNEATFGAIPAESTLTIIDVLEFLDLKESADYYRSRLFLVIGRNRTDMRHGLHVFSWETESHIASRSSNLSTESLASDQAGLMKVFQSMMLAGAATDDEDGGGLDFNPYDPLWSMISREDGYQHQVAPLQRPVSRDL